MLLFQVKYKEVYNPFYQFKQVTLRSRMISDGRSLQLSLRINYARQNYASSSKQYIVQKF